VLIHHVPGQLFLRWERFATHVARSDLFGAILLIALAHEAPPFGLFSSEYPRSRSSTLSPDPPRADVCRQPLEGSVRITMAEVVKSLWASIQGDPVFMRRVNGWLTIFWIVMIPVSIATGWITSVTYVAALSLWALVSGHWSAWQAARVEVKQQKEEEASTPKPGSSLNDSTALGIRQDVSTGTVLDSILKDGLA
jgi:hypothetical protein